jgi:outer membrane protein assembly factor BamD
MFLNKKIALLALSASLSFVSCNEYQKALKSTDTKVKYDAAESSYKAGDYRQASRLFEQIAPKYIGKPQGERVLFFFADSYFKIKDYNTAGYQFERFLKSYPNSDKSIEAAFFSAKSYYELSPKYSLDQTDTDKALAKLQNFINAYGESPYIEEANILAKELRVKKEEKAYEIAKQYYKIAVGFDYTILFAAEEALNNFLVDFPGSPFREDVLYYQFATANSIAFYSVADKKEDRITNAKEAYVTLIKYYPNSKYLEEANQVSEKLEKELSEITK